MDYQKFLDAPTGNICDANGGRGVMDAGIHPLVPEKGSLGASGDLAPLSHIALGLIGEGNHVRYIINKEKFLSKL